MKTLPLLCAALLLVSGCAGRDYAIPDQGLMNATQIEENYRVDREWWKAYGDESLNRLVDTALERNLDLARSTISVNRTLYQARQLGANLVPSFSASGDASSRTDMESGHASRSFNATFGLAYELDLWGRLRNAASAGAWEYHATEQDRESTRLALINSVVNTWYSMAQTTRSLELSRESLTFYERLLAIVQAQYAAGKTDGLDPAQTEQSLLSQQATVLTLEQQLAGSDPEELPRLLEGQKQLREQTAALTARKEECAGRLRSNRRASEGYKKHSVGLAAAEQELGWVGALSDTASGTAKARSTLAFRLRFETFRHAFFGRPSLEWPQQS